MRSVVLYENSYSIRTGAKGNSKMAYFSVDQSIRDYCFRDIFSLSVL